MSSTVWRPSALSRFDTAHPAEPEPTTMKSNSAFGGTSDTYILKLLCDQSGARQLHGAFDIIGVRVRHPVRARSVNPHLAARGRHIRRSRAAAHTGGGTQCP